MGSLGTLIADLLARLTCDYLKIWRRAIREAGLGPGADSRGILEARAGNLHVRLSRFREGRAHGTRITVSGPWLPSDIMVRPEGVGTDLLRLRGAREIEIGDEPFDAAAWVQGRPAVVRALLDADNRRAVRMLLEGRLEREGPAPFWAAGRIHEGVLRVDVPEAIPPLKDFPGPLDAPVPGDAVVVPARLGEALRAVLDLARRLAVPADVPRRLADNLKTEPVAGVRRQCLLTLVRESPDHPATREALLAARADPDAGVRLGAGIALGSEGRETLLGVASGEGAQDETTERAVAALGRHMTTVQAKTVLHNALRTRREATARACLFALGRRREPEAIATVAKVLAVETQGLAVAAAEALGLAADPSAEAALLAALSRPQGALRVAAARALGRVGTTAAVLPLKEAEERGGELRRTARQAIAEIQARVTGAAPGQLSLAEGHSGRLSLAPEKQGRLSLAVPSPADGE